MLWLSEYRVRVCKAFERTNIIEKHFFRKVRMYLDDNRTLVSSSRASLWFYFTFWIKVFLLRKELRACFDKTTGTRPLKVNNVYNNLQSEFAVPSAEGAPQAAMDELKARASREREWSPARPVHWRLRSYALFAVVAASQRCVTLNSLRSRLANALALRYRDDKRRCAFAVVRKKHPRSTDASRPARARIREMTLRSERSCRWKLQMKARTCTFDVCVRNCGRARDGWFQ